MQTICVVLTDSTAILGAIFSLISMSLSANSCLSSVAMMDSTEVPRTFTPYFSRMPRLNNSTPDRHTNMIPIRWRVNHKGNGNVCCSDPQPRQYDCITQNPRAWGTHAVFPPYLNNCRRLTAVECCLPTHGQQDAVWMLDLDDFSNKFWRDRQEVDRVGLLGAHFVGLNWGNVWVHEHCF